MQCRNGFLFLWLLGLGVGIASWVGAQENLLGPVPISPPVTPTAPTRPNSWPSDATPSRSGNTGSVRPSKSGGVSLSSIPYTDTSVTSEAGATAIKGFPVPHTDAATANGLMPCEGTQIIARVGSEVILACEIFGSVNRYIDTHKNEIPPDQLDAVRQQQFVAILGQLIKVKLLYSDAKRSIPREALARVENELSSKFDSMEIDRLLKQTNLSSRDDLNAQLCQAGSSLAIERRAFIESVLAQEWMRQKVKFEGEVTGDETLAYYRKHLKDFESPARVRWEELMVNFSKYPNKDAALNAISKMGNQVLQGRPFADVAKELSDGATAASGGRQDWTTKGSLVSTELDQALFGLPVGELSQIIETKLGFHIVRVIERKVASCTPFVEAQVKIRDLIRDQKSQEQYQEYVDKLKQQTVIATIFDDMKNLQQAGLSAPLPR